MQIGGNATLLQAYPFNGSISPGAVAGVYIKKHMSEWGAQIGLQLSTSQYTTAKSAAYKYAGNTYFTGSADTAAKGKYTNLTVQIPAIAEIRTGKHLALQIGAVYSYLATQLDKNDAMACFYKKDDLFKKSNVGGFFGLEIELTKKLRLGASYTVNFMNQNNGKFQNIDDKWLNMNGQILFSYQLKRWHGKKL
jgi:hypothetical protein